MAKAELLLFKFANAPPRTAVVPLSVPPVDARRRTRGTNVEYAGTRWACYEANPGLCRISWVEGELPWVAKVGDSLAYADSISPPFMLSADWTPTASAWYRPDSSRPGGGAPPTADWDESRPMPRPWSAEGGCEAGRGWSTFPRRIRSRTTAAA